MSARQLADVRSPQLLIGKYFAYVCIYVQRTNTFKWPQLLVMGLQATT